MIAQVVSRQLRSRPMSEIAVLIVTADPTVRELYGLKFALDAYVVMHLAVGESAERCVAERRPDLVFADIRDPAGWELVEQLRLVESADTIPLLLLSNHRKDELARRGFGLRPNEYVLMSAEHRADLRIA